MITSERRTHCADCGTALSSEPWAPGLCVACLIELALDTSLTADGDDPSVDAPTLDATSAALRAGLILGERYRIRSRLGGGGMGEVWRAFDMKLRVDVALKALHARLLENERALDTLRQEVRSAREVISPNVCRVFDLVELDGSELISMEYVDGATLKDLLQEESPLELDRARDLAAQMLAGLEAIHDAGLVHRDVKPENVMLTRAGRVVVMDFGIARALERRAGTVAGTPAYMAPEQARGDPLDARADVYAAGIVLAEMIDPEGVRDSDARQRLWQRCREEPPTLAETPWAPILRKAIAADPKQRPVSAAALSRALEEVTARAVDEGVAPYPGLAYFTEADAENFFGRELEVEALWKKLRRLHLLGLIGPSGTGKTSFLRAGALPAKPPGWGVLITTPGVRPFTALAEALAVELAGDTDAVRELVGFDEPAKAIAAVKRWRDKHDRALVIVDQFEELFTQNSTEVQQRFADLLGRLSLEADVRVLLSLRDDFLADCGQQQALAPIFEALTVLNPLQGSALRRAVVQPALRQGYRFEDEALIEEILAEVEGERGALPLLAFAAAQLWQRRDRERGLLTREAYEEIGGVAGALARHAEETLEQIGHDRMPVVRELFRHLVTAQRTRATWEREELLSTFGDGDRKAAERVLAALIDARLLTSYELETDDDEQVARHRVEVIHESLLGTWPRLVRWQGQDEDSAHLLDQLRQTAQLWEERGRPEDLLWSGTSFKEYELWRNHFSGGLSCIEEAFADAMVDKAERRRRRRRLALATAFALLLGVLGIVAALWRQSVVAVAGQRAAVGAGLAAWGRNELDSDPRESSPTTALAYALASLELSDQPATRRYVMEALWSGPAAIGGPRSSGVLSSDGKWIQSGYEEGGLIFHRTEDGSMVHVPIEAEFTERALGGPSAFGRFLEVTAIPGRDLFLEVYERIFKIYSHPPGYARHTVQLFETSGVTRALDSERLLRLERHGDEVLVESWPIDGGASTDLGRMDAAFFSFTGPQLDQPWFRVQNDLLYTTRGTTAWAHRVDGLAEGPVWSLEHDSTVVRPPVASPSGNRLATADDSAGVRIWSLGPEGPSYERLLPEALRRGAWDPTGRRIATHSSGRAYAEVWDLGAPPDAAPFVLHRSGQNQFGRMDFDGTGEWIVASGWPRAVAFWNVASPPPLLLPGHESSVMTLEFSPDGRWLASGAREAELRLWPLSSDAGDASQIVWSVPGDPSDWILSVAWHPEGSYVLAGTTTGQVWLVEPRTGNARELKRGGQRAFVGNEIQGPMNVDFSPDGRFAAAAGHVRLGDLFSGPLVWDVETGDVVHEFTLEQEQMSTGGWNFYHFQYGSDGKSLVTGSPRGIRVWSLEDGSSEYIGDGNYVAQSRDGHRVFGTWGLSTKYIDLDDSGAVRVHDLDTNHTEVLTAHPMAMRVALASEDRILVTGDWDGVVRVGPATGEEPHLLLGHEGSIWALDVSPDGRWIASGGDDTTIRLWPMPDVTKPPFHTLPHAELLEALRKLTNCRAVEDPESDTGYSIEYAPFEGTADYPEWYPPAPEVTDAGDDTGG